MKKTLLNNLKFIIFGLVVAIGVSAAYAVSNNWAAPTSSAPSNTIEVPLHTGPDQIKIGGLSVGPFAAFSNAELNQQVYLNGMVRGGDPTTANSQVKFGDSAHVVNSTVAGNVNVVGTLQGSSVANANSSTLCAAKDGTIITCGAAPAVAETYTIAAQQIVWPIPDYAYTGNSNNSYAVAFCLSSPALRNLQFTVIYATGAGIPYQVRTVSATIPAGQSCMNNAPSGVVLAADSNPANHTKVGNAQSQCLYNGTDVTYQSPAYQGYAVNVDPSLRCP